MNDLRLNNLPIADAVNGVGANVTGGGKTKADEGVDFTSLVKQSIDEVNRTQQGAKELAERFEMGDPNVDLTRVMVEMQKARVSFTALSQVRNKLVEAYREVMNMQV